MIIKITSRGTIGSSFMFKNRAKKLCRRLIIISSSQRILTEWLVCFSQESIHIKLPAHSSTRFSIKTGNWRTVLLTHKNEEKFQNHHFDHFNHFESHPKLSFISINLTIQSIVISCSCSIHQVWSTCKSLLFLLIDWTELDWIESADLLVFIDSLVDDRWSIIDICWRFSVTWMHSRFKWHMTLNGRWIHLSESVESEES
jgi:hypothetical protein